MLSVNGPEEARPLEEQKFELGMRYVRRIEADFEAEYGVLPDYNSSTDFVKLARVTSLFDIEEKSRIQGTYLSLTGTGISRYSIASLLIREAFSRDGFFDQCGPLKDAALDALVGILSYEGANIETKRRMSGLETLKIQGILTDDFVSEFYESVERKHHASAQARLTHYELVNASLGDSFLNSLVTIMQPVHYTRQTEEDLYTFLKEYFESS